MSLSMVARSVALLVVCSVVARAQSGTGARFVPSVDIADSVGTCAPMTAAVKPGEHGYLLRLGTADSAARVISAIWDSTGKLRSYSDGRGDMRGPPIPMSERGPRTTIILDFAKNGALLFNESHGRTRGSVMTTPADVIDDPRLGPPRAMLAQLHTRCGAPIGP